MRLDSKAFFLEGGEQCGILEGQGGGNDWFLSGIGLVFHGENRQNKYILIYFHSQNL